MKNASQECSLSFMELCPEPIFTPLLVDFFYLTDYCRSVTIVTKTKTTFFTREIGQLPENWPIWALFWS